MVQYFYMNTKKFFIAVFFFVFAFFGMSHAQHAYAAVTDNVYGEAWSDNVGWISFNNCASPTDASAGCTTAVPYGVNMGPTGNLSGEAWSDSLGWISFNANSTTGCTAQPKVNLSTGALSGFAWAQSTAGNGWNGCIAFSAADDGQSGWGMNASLTTGAITGQGWGDSLNMGWVLPAADMKIISPQFNPAVPAPSLSISSSSTPLLLTNPKGPGVTYTGGPYTLSWPAVANATSCTLEGSSVSVNGGTLNGQAQSWAGNTHNFVLSCTGPGGTGTSTVSNISYPPDPSGLSSSCNTQGTKATISWTGPSGYNTFYTRASTPVGDYSLYNDSATGMSGTFSTTPGASYTWWVHTRDPGDNAWSNPAYGPSINCPNPNPNGQSSYSITATQTAGGTISPGGVTSVPANTSQTYSINPNFSEKIVDVSVDNSSVGAVSSYVFTNVITNHTITATFANNNTGGSCADGIQNQNETGIDTGGVCGNGSTGTCFDHKKNQNETGIDTGGVCGNNLMGGSCSDGIKDQNETGIDTGGVCGNGGSSGTCFDRIRNQDETGIDTGGVCGAPQCSDGIDNDGDGLIDYNGGTLPNGTVVGKDPQCTSPTTAREKGIIYIEQ
jgi:hypothetical protein